MKVSVAALSCLMLVTALGSQARVTKDAETEFMMSKLPLENPVLLDRFHATSADCCISYTPRSIPCSLLESYFETNSECSKPGVIFLTKKGRRFCANPSDKQVQVCMRMLKLDTRIKTRKN
ncbi:C-C motif chemokine ligand 23 [Homo sapiens]|uniref:C-C motif chemokine 23 n=1 Tax=Homo sapiens TaxID=9606 RepID=CCL23_HUMAN|eukprot:NP_665905.2 C-C motif chemokine 23 isoform CKbeta8 precursor [Homo sapiens]